MKHITLHFTLKVKMSVPDDLTDDELRLHAQTVRFGLCDGIFEQHSRGLGAEGADVHEVILSQERVSQP